MTLGMEVGLGPGDFVLDGYPAPSTQKGAEPSPNFRPVYCGQTAAWIKMPLGTEVALCYMGTQLLSIFGRVAGSPS